jgi:hypothetical protein
MASLVGRLAFVVGAGRERRRYHRDVAGRDSLLSVEVVVGTGSFAQDVRLTAKRGALVGS